MSGRWSFTLFGSLYEFPNPLDRRTLIDRYVDEIAEENDRSQKLRTLLEAKRKLAEAKEINRQLAKEIAELDSVIEPKPVVKQEPPKPRIVRVRD